MKLIQPAEISGKIMTLIDQAKTDLIIVSPYNKFKYWKKLTQRIQKAIERGVSIKWYIRSKVKESFEAVKSLGITPIEIDNLHCKIYLNEKNAVVTSMNLYEYSDHSSLDIGYWISEPKQFSEIQEFITTHIDSKHLDLINFKTNIHLSAEHSDRITRLKRVAKFIQHHSLEEKIAELTDRKGELTVTWKSTPNLFEKDITRRAWEDEYEYDIVHKVKD